jgi:bisphosphoglycerate-dependent phosphoglycerate mutase
MGDFETKLKPEFKEKGTNVSIDFEFLRHGDPGPEGLSMKGDEQSKQYGQKLAEKLADFKKIYSSTILRAKQTRDIAYKQFSEIEKKMSIPRDEAILSYENIKTEPKFSWQKHIKEQLTSDFAELSEEKQESEKIKAETSAVKKCFEDREFTREAASHIAYLVNKYFYMTEKLNSDSKIILLEISHNSLLMSFLKETLYRINEEGKKILGFDNPEDIGGALAPTESFIVKIKTDENRKKNIEILFSNQNRMEVGRYGLDVNKVKELALEYKKITQDTLKS